MIEAMQELVEIRDRIKPAVHGGLRLSSEETVVLVGKLNTAIELVRETEDERRVLDLALKARKAGKPRLKLIPTSGGTSA